MTYLLITALTDLYGSIYYLYINGTQEEALSRTYMHKNIAEFLNAHYVGGRVVSFQFIPREGADSAFVQALIEQAPTP